MREQNLRASLDLAGERANCGLTIGIIDRRRTGSQSSRRDYLPFTCRVFSEEYRLGVIHVQFFEMGILTGGQANTDKPSASLPYGRAPLLLVNSFILARRRHIRCRTDRGSQDTYNLGIESCQTSRSYCYCIRVLSTPMKSCQLRLPRYFDPGVWVIVIHSSALH